MELRSCFSSAFWVCVSGCDEAAIIEFFVAGSDESAVDKSEDEPGTVIEPCNVFVVDTALDGPVLRVPEEMGWPVTFTGAVHDRHGADSHKKHHTRLVSVPESTETAAV